MYQNLELPILKCNSRLPNPRRAQAIIEFLGHAGSGKSYLCNQLVNLLGTDCVSTEEFSMTIGDALRFGLSQPAQLFMSIRLVICSRQRNLRSFSRSVRRMLAYMVKLSVAKSTNRRYILVSEGILKIFNDIRSTSANSHFGYEALPPALRRSLFRHPDVIILVTVPLEIAAQRLALRQNPNATATDTDAWRTRIEGNFFRSLTDNRNNIAKASLDHEFIALEIENDGRIPSREIVKQLRSVLDKFDS